MIRPKDVIGRYKNSFRRMVRPKDLIGRYEKSVRRMMSGRDEDVVLKIVRRSVRRILIGRDEDVILKIVRRSIRRILIERDEATCPYDNVSDLSSCQTDLIERERKLVLSSGTLLIGQSDGLVLLKRFLLADPIDLLSASCFGFFVARFQTAIHN